MKNARVSGVFEVSAAPDNGVSSFKQTVFIRQDSAPSTPTGGSYDSPYPDEEGWEDGIPDGDNALWASNRIFTSDGKPPQQAKWSVPKPMADTSSFRVRYSSVEKPSGNPDEAPSEWAETGSDDTRWIATIAKENGVWGMWVVTKIVGESAEYYMVMAEVASISRTKDGYSPYIFEVSEYHVKGATKEATNVYWFDIYGVKGSSRTLLKGLVGTVQNYQFNASTYYEDDYDAFIFELRTNDGVSLASTSVSVSRDGKDGANGTDGADGEKGATPRVRKWQPDTYYMAGGTGETYGDLVYEEGSTIPYECMVSHWSVEGEPPSVLVTHSDPTKRYWRAGEYRYMIANDIMLSRLIIASEIDVKNLLVQMLETKGSGATIRIKEGLMEVFGSVNKNEPNIRFGVNDDGYAVLQYYDNDGRFLYDLGPNGISALDVREEKWLSYHRYYLGSAESSVVSGQDYVNVLYSEGSDVYKYVSKMVEGVLEDPDNDGLFFSIKSVAASNRLDGWYCLTAPEGSSKESYQEFMMVEDGDGDWIPPSDLSAYNPTLYYGFGYVIYYKTLEHYTDGKLDKTQNVYWSEKRKPVASGI